MNTKSRIMSTMSYILTISPDCVYYKLTCKLRRSMIPFLLCASFVNHQLCYVDLRIVNNESVHRKEQLATRINRAERTAGHLRVNDIICIVTHTSLLKTRAHVGRFDCRTCVYFYVHTK